MSDLPSIDYSCARCGASQTYQLVPGSASEPDPASAGPPPIASIDLTCARCGTSQTYQLVPVSARAHGG